MASSVHACLPVFLHADECLENRKLPEPVLYGFCGFLARYRT